MAALGQPAVGVPAQPIPTEAQIKTFTEYYNDASLDEFHGAYASVMGIFASPGVVANTPALIRDLVSSDPRNSSMGYAALVVSPQQAAAPGLIYGLHTISKYATRLGHPATPWDGDLFASLHDVVGNQIPATVHFPILMPLLDKVTVPTTEWPWHKLWMRSLPLMPTKVLWDPLLLPMQEPNCSHVATWSECRIGTCVTSSQDP
jgi:hypothetical protein